MNPKPNARRVRAFFLIDRVGGEEGKFVVLEGLLNRLLNQLAHDSTIRSSVRPSVIAMGAATCQKVQIRRFTPNQVKLFTRTGGCDLGGALRLLESSLRVGDSKDQVEVFVFLHSEPAGDWQAGIETLKARGRVRLHFFPFVGETGVQPDTVKEISAKWADGLATLQQFTARNMEWVFNNNILRTLKRAVETVNTPPPPVGGPPGRSPSQQPSGLRVGSGTEGAVSAMGDQHQDGVRQPEQTEAVEQPKVAPLAHGVGGVVVQHNTATQAKKEEVGQLEQTETGEQTEIELPTNDVGGAGQRGMAMPAEAMQAEQAREGTVADQVPPEKEQATPEGMASESSGEPATGWEEEMVGDVVVKEGTISPVAEVEPPPPPRVDEQGVATIWKELEPPEDLGDRVAHEVNDVLDASDNWRMIGASRRGKMHAHKGIFREDAFALGKAEGWHLMVVADGGGSCSLSRVGSQLAADTAVATMAQFVESASGAKLSAEEICQMALRQGLEHAWEALSAEAGRREIPLRELGTTFLSVMHLPSEQGSILGVAQVGDGLVAAELADGTIVPLAEPDVGDTAGVTLFLTSKPWKEWIDRVDVQTLEAQPRLLAAMCDGVADDFIPYEKHLRTLFDHLEKIIEQEQPRQALLDYLRYPKRGSFDDRTLTLIYQAQVTVDPALASEAEAEAEAQGDEEPAGESQGSKRARLFRRR